MKIQTLAAPAGLPKGAKEGRVLIEGLMVNEKGKTEPIMVIRGLDPACERLVLGYLDSIHISSSYSAEFRSEAKVQAASLTAWRMQHSDGPRELDKYTEIKDGALKMPQAERDTEMEQLKAKVLTMARTSQQAVIERDKLKRELSLVEISNQDKGVEALIAACHKADARATEAERRLKDGGAGEKIKELEAQVSKLQAQLDAAPVPDSEQGLDVGTKVTELQGQVGTLADKVQTLTRENTKLKGELAATAKKHKKK